MDGARALLLVSDEVMSSKPMQRHAASDCRPGVMISPKIEDFPLDMADNCRELMVCVSLCVCVCACVRVRVCLHTCCCLAP